MWAARIALTITGALFMAAGCVQTPDVAVPENTIIEEDTPSPVPSYLIGPKDDLVINVVRVVEIENLKTRVMDDGFIALPLAGPVHVAGLTITQAANAISEALLKYVKNPMVTVSVVAVGSKEVYVLGAVGAQQPVLYSRGLTLVQALARCNGFEDTKSRTSEIRVVRVGPDRTVNCYIINLRKILDGKTPDFPLQCRDIVYVPLTRLTILNAIMKQITGTTLDTANTINEVRRTAE